MERNTINTLSVKFWGTIETPPLNNRETFRQSVIDTVMIIVHFQDVTIDYIGYRPDQTGVHVRNADHMVYEDCIFVSLNVPSIRVNRLDNEETGLISEFIRIFENKTHKHLVVDSTIIDKKTKKYQIEMISDWKYYLKQG